VLAPGMARHGANKQRQNEQISAKAWIMAAASISRGASGIKKTLCTAAAHCAPADVAVFASAPLRTLLRALRRACATFSRWASENNGVIKRRVSACKHQRIGGVKQHHQWRFAYGQAISASKHGVWQAMARKQWRGGGCGNNGS